MKQITCTDKLKMGTKTSSGIVKVIHNNASFTTTDGWFVNVRETQVFLTSK